MVFAHDWFAWALLSAVFAALNLPTAQALGLTVPPSVLRRAVVVMP
jgi:hypothetical protein